MLIIFIKTCVYITLTLLAYACVQTANDINPKAGKCKKISLICIIVGCATTTMSVFYNLSTIYLLGALVPLFIGISFWLITHDAEIHHKIDKFITNLKNQFTRRAVRR